MPYAHPEALVESEWLAAYLEDPHVRILDASFTLPGVTPTARENYDRGHLPGAVFFDIDDIAAARHQPAAHDPVGRFVRAKDRGDRRRRWRQGCRL